MDQAFTLIRGNARNRRARLGDMALQIVEGTLSATDL
jgi:AmiR/NasT family two-component response regulator